MASVKDGSTTSPRSRLYLHPIHSAAAANGELSLTPIKCSPALDRVIVAKDQDLLPAAARLAKQAVQVASAEAHAVEDGALFARLCKQTHSLKVTRVMGAPESLLDIRLPLAEVANAVDPSGRRLLAVVPGPELRPECQPEDADEFDEEEEESLPDATDPPVRELCAWLFMLQGDEADLSGLLDTLSSLGAVRTGLDELYEMNDLKELGVGGCATVFLTRRRSGEAGKGEPTAVKLANQPGTRKDELLVKEASLLSRAQGQVNVIRLYGLFRSTGIMVDVGELGYQWAMALEFCSGGDLQQIVAASGPLTEAKAKIYIAGLLRALAHVHDRGIVHRDVKRENVLIAEGERPVLTDFGVAALLADRKAMAVRCGSLGFVAPEVLRKRSYGVKVDVFGLGATLYWMLGACLPFAGKDIATVLRRNMRCQVSLDVPTLDLVSTEAKDFLLLLLQRCPEGRPFAEEARTHAWLEAKDEGVCEAPCSPRRVSNPQAPCNPRRSSDAQAEEALAATSFMPRPPATPAPACRRVRAPLVAACPWEPEGEPPELQTPASDASKSPGAAAAMPQPRPPSKPRPQDARRRLPQPEKSSTPSSGSTGTPPDDWQDRCVCVMRGSRSEAWDDGVSFNEVENHRFSRASSQSGTLNARKSSWASVLGNSFRDMVRRSFKDK